MLQEYLRLYLSIETISRPPQSRETIALRILNIRKFEAEYKKGLRPMINSPREDCLMKELKVEKNLVTLCLS
jgi:hypothetical protein